MTLEHFSKTGDCCPASYSVPAFVERGLGCLELSTSGLYEVVRVERARVDDRDAIRVISGLDVGYVAGDFWDDLDPDGKCPTDPSEVAYESRVVSVNHYSRCKEVFECACDLLAGLWRIDVEGDEPVQDAFVRYVTDALAVAEHRVEWRSIRVPTVNCYGYETRAFRVLHRSAWGETDV